MGFFDIVKKIVGIPTSSKLVAVATRNKGSDKNAKLNLLIEEFRMVLLKVEGFAYHMDRNCNKYTLPSWQKKFYYEIIGNYIILLQRTEREAKENDFELPFQSEVITAHYLALKLKLYTFTLDPFKSLAKSELTRIEYECKNVMISMRQQIENNISASPTIRKAS